MPSPEEAPRPSPPKPPTVREAHQRRDPPPPPGCPTYLRPPPALGKEAPAGRGSDGREGQNGNRTSVVSAGQRQA